MGLETYAGVAAENGCGGAGLGTLTTLAFTLLGTSISIYDTSIRIVHTSISKICCERRRRRCRPVVLVVGARHAGTSNIIVRYKNRNTERKGALR